VTRALGGLHLASGDACARFRPDLLELLDDPLGTHLSEAARRHLDACSTCRADVAETVLTGVALRRSFLPAASASPSDDAWPRLQARLQRSRGSGDRTGHVASPAAGLALSLVVVLAVLVPFGRPADATQLHESGVDPAAVRAASDREAVEEMRLWHAALLAGRQDAAQDDVNWAREDLIRQEIAPIAQMREPAHNPVLASVE
jgi:hypothetical protein